MKKKLTALILAMVLLFTTGAISASAYDEDLAASINYNYSKALSLAGRSSFHGYCNLATAYQLLALGIYSGSTDYSGTGNSWYNYYSNKTETSGSYKVVTISGANCLNDLVSKYGNRIYNVVYSLGSGGSSGSTHVMLIRAIIDGYVYFADSFATQYGTQYYSEGACTILSLDKFITVYREMNGNPYGCVYFTKDGSEHITGDSDEWETIDKDYTTGNYTITASLLRIREDAGTDYTSLGVVENGETVTVTDVNENWGKIQYNNISGWICLDYALKTEEEPTPVPELTVNSIKADTMAVNTNSEIKWTAEAEGGDSEKYLYSFTVYMNGETVYTSEFSSECTLTFTPGEEGIYTTVVSVKDSDGCNTEGTSDNVCAVDEIESIVSGDTDGNGKVTAADARLALRISANIEMPTSRNIVGADVNGDGKITSADARAILRITASI